MLFLAYPPIDCLTGWMHKGFRCGYKFQVWHLEINIPMSRLLKMDLLKIQRKKKKRTQKGTHYALQYQKTLFSSDIHTCIRPTHILAPTQRRA